MKDLKFSYIAQHEDTHLWMEQVFTLVEIEGSDFINQWHKKFPRWNIVARRLWTGIKDENGKEIFEGDIVKMSHEATVCPDSNLVIKAYYANFVAHTTQSRFYVCTTIHELCDNELFSGKPGDGIEAKIIGDIWRNPELLKS